MVEGAVPGSREGYVLISKPDSAARARGFAGSGTVDPLKASKKAGGKRNKLPRLAGHRSHLAANKTRRGWGTRT